VKGVEPKLKMNNGFLIIILFVPVQGGRAQSFVNLDFESAQIIPLTQSADFPPYSVATSNALPGWTVYYGGTSQSQINYNAPGSRFYIG
jgi:hypothetical protein